MPRPHLVALAPLLAFSGVTSAQGVVQLIENGVPVGSAIYRRAQDLAVDDDGRWSVIARSSQGWLLLHDGALVSNAGASMPAGLAGSVEEFLHVEAPGTGLALEILSDHQVALSGQVSVLWNDVVVASEGELVLAAGVPAGTTFASVALLDANDRGQVLLLATLAPGGPALVRYDLDETGAVTSGAVLLRVGDVVPGASEPVTALEQGEIDGHGGWLGVVEIGTRSALVHDGQLLAIEGGPSPVLGRPFVANFALRFPSLNARGQCLFSATIEGDAATSSIVVLDGRVFAQAGDYVPGVGLVDYVGALAVTDGGEVFWGATVDGRPYMLRDGVSFLDAPVDGRAIEQLRPAMDVSDNGRFFLGEVEFEDGGIALLRVDFGAAVPIQGCEGNPGRLELVGGLALPGQTLELLLDAPVRDGEIALLKLSLARAPGGPDCGFPTPFGEFLIDPRATFATLPVGVTGAGPLVLSLPIPADPALVDLEVFAQGAFLRLQAPLRVTMTNGLALAIGAP